MPPKHPLRFHWSAYPEESLCDAGAFLNLCHDAERVGIESVVVPIATCLSDGLELASAMGQETARVRFRVACDYRGILASLYGRELKKACEILGTRLIIHIIFAGDEAARNGNLLSATEFIANCRKESKTPQFDVEGSSSEAAFLAIKQADCLWRCPDKPNQVYADALPVNHFGKEVGLLSFVIARETREEALEFAAPLLSGDCVEGGSNSASWITPDLWTGILPGYEEKRVILIGSFEQVAHTIYGFKKSGISQFLIREGPGQREMTYFGERILPLIRAIEWGTTDSREQCGSY